MLGKHLLRKPFQRSTLSRFFSHVDRHQRDWSLFACLDSGLFFAIRRSLSLSLSREREKNKPGIRSSRSYSFCTHRKPFECSLSAPSTRIGRFDGRQLEISRESQALHCFSLGSRQTPILGTSRLCAPSVCRPAGKRGFVEKWRTDCPSADLNRAEKCRQLRGGESLAECRSDPSDESGQDIITG